MNLVLITAVCTIVWLTGHTSCSQEQAAGNQHAGSIASVADSLPERSYKISVTGDVVRPLQLTVDSLYNMPTDTVTRLVVVCQSGVTTHIRKQCRGVLLRNILHKAGLPQTAHKDRNFYFIARATDHYKATFSWGEIFNHQLGDSVWVLFEEDGLPIKDQGAFVLISASDRKTGPRQVQMLTAIEAHRVD